MDYERLRSDLIDYLGTAMSYNPMAVMELSNVKNTSNDEETIFILDDINITRKKIISELLIMII